MARQVGARDHVRPLSLALLLSALGLFILDVISPRGLAVAAPQLLIVLIALRHLPRQMALAAAIGCSILILAGYGLSAGADELSHARFALVHRFIILVILWSLVVVWTRVYQGNDPRLRLLAQVVESSDDVIFSKTLDGRIVSWNAAAARVYGHAAQEVIGRHVSLLAPPERWDEIEEILQRVRRGERVDDLETVRVRKDGTPLAMNVTVFPVRDESGTIVCAATIARDVTHVRRAREALLRSDARYRSLASVAGSAAWTADATGAFAIPQAAWHTLTGQPWERHRGFGWLDALHPEDREPYRQAWRDAVEKRVPFQTQARIWNAESRRHRFVSIAAVPVENQEGEVGEWIGVAHDVDRLRRTSDELAQRTLRLQEADARKNEFLAILGHELRNPVAGLDAALRLLSRTRATDRDRRWAEDTLRENVSLLATLLDDLLDLNRIAHGRMQLRRRAVLLDEVVQRAAESTRTVMAERGHDFRVEFEARRLIVHADPARVEQMTTNLLSNAAKYTPPGGSVRLRVERSDGLAQVRVIDDGIGITQDRLREVFEPFRRIGDDWSGSEGLGIGLAIVRRLAEMHGGTVLARSEGPGTGSEFTFSLPLATAELPAEESPPAPQPRPAAAGLHVLVVDDNPSSARGLSRLLELEGFQVETAGDGATALRRAPATAPEVVVLDIGLPDVSGYEVVKRLRADPRLVATTFIAVSGYGHEEAIRRALESGFHHHLAKPVDLDDLLRLFPRRPGEGAALA